MNIYDFESVRKEIIESGGEALLRADSKFRTADYSTPKPGQENRYAELFEQQRTLAKLAVADIPNVLKRLSKRLQSDKEVVMAALVVEPLSLRYASAELQTDPEIAAVYHRLLDGTQQPVKPPFFVAERNLSNIQTNEGLPLHSKTTNFIARKNAALALIEKNPESFKYLSEDLRDDSEVVSAAIIKESTMLKYASNRLQHDSAIGAIYFKTFESEKTAPVLSNKNNYIGQKTAALASVKSNPKSFKSLIEDLKNDREIVIAAILQEPALLKYASNRMQNDSAVIAIYFETLEIKPTI